jgi:hypothetical protein
MFCTSHDASLDLVNTCVNKLEHYSALDDVAKNTEREPLPYLGEEITITI